MVVQAALQQHIFENSLFASDSGCYIERMAHRKHTDPQWRPVRWDIPTSYMSCTKRYVIMSLFAATALRAQVLQQCNINGAHEGRRKLDIKSAGGGSIYINEYRL